MNNITNLLQFLITQKTGVNASTICSALNISKRTFQRLIHEINNNNEIIHKTSNGYTINIQAYTDSAYFKMNEENRLNTLMKKLTFANESLNLYDLAESLFISESTLINDLKKAKAIFNQYGIELTYKNNYINVDHNEKLERNLIRNYIYGEVTLSKGNIMEAVNQMSAVDVHRIRKIITKVINNYQMYVDEYTLFNILLHIIIKIERNKQYFVIQHNQLEEKYTLNEYYQIANEICLCIKNSFNITFNESEVYELGLLLYSSLHKDIQNSTEEYVSPVILTKTENIVKYIHDIYGINLSNQQFIRNFSLHLKNLYTRIENNIIVKNPISNQIKENFPFIFEISLDILKETFNDVKINEDEISFFALHIATQINMQEDLRKKLKCILISPDFYTLNKNLYETIRNRFSNQIYIVDILSSPSKLIDYDQIDIVITPIEISVPNRDKIIKINLIPTQRDFENIEFVINQLLVCKLTNNLSNIISSYFNEKNFYIVNEVMNFQKAITIGTNLLKNHCELPPSFATDCIQRELTFPTTFKDIAVPHPIKCNVNKSSVLILVNSKYFNWSNKRKIKCIFILAINNKEMKYLYPFYEYLANYINNDKETDRFSHIKNYSDILRALNSYHID